jgi:four helix bundle suffix protein
MTESFLPSHGGFRNLRTFRIAQIVYDGTVIFCDRFIDKRSRTYDQMVQAARSGVQNIAEGSLASATSKETELKLTNVARASLGELLLDCEDFLRQRGLRQWHKDSEEAMRVRGLYRSDKSDGSDLSDYGFNSASAETAANTLLCLINQASSLLLKQIRQLEQDFLARGGLRERMSKARLEVRAAQEAAKEPEAPACPNCAKPMRQRTARTGPKAGKPFWGCSGYPECRGVRSIEK